MSETKKDMRKLHDLPRFRDLINSKKGIIRNHKAGGTVDMAWGWNEDASLDQIFSLRFRHNGEPVELFLDWQELMHYGRAVSDWKGFTEEAKRKREAGLI